MRNTTTILLVSLMSFISGCSVNGGGTSTGNPLVEVRIDSYNSTLSAQKSTVDALALTTLKFCFKRIRFKMSGQSTNPDPTQDSSNLEFYLGEVTISSLGTTLDGVSLPAGTYSRVEFDLESDCPSGKSVQLTNSNGSFSTDDRITIKFEGTFAHTGAGDVLTLGIQQIVSALNTVSNSSQIRNTAESVSGDF